MVTAAPFSVTAMLAQAGAETGLKDFGGEEFLDALRRLVDSTNAEMRLNQTGVLAFQAEVHRLLVNRLRFADDLKRHPEILDEDVSDPVVIVGLPRTGTTKLQRMLSADPGMQDLSYWRLLNPAPIAGAADDRATRLDAARQALAVMRQLAPGFLDSHPMTAEDADEETFLQLFTFKSPLTYLLHPAPGFWDWLQQQPRRSTYQYMKRMLQYLQWQDGGKRNRPWVLKSPVHVGNLDLLVEMFPAATIVVTHRHYHEAVPSFCRLIEMGWRARTDDVDTDAIGRLGVELWSGEMARHVRQREALGDRIDLYDVRYEQVRDAPLQVIGEIYRRAGRRLTPDAEQAMRAWEGAHPQPGGGKPQYSLSDYGLTTAIIDEAFAAYIRRFLA